MDLRLRGLNAIVTGGGRGLGREICAGLAAEGANVATCGRDRDALVATERRLAEVGVRARADVVDVRVADDYRRWIDDAVGWLGGVDVFVANASAMAVGDDEKAWQDSIEVDLMHTVRGCQAVVPHMREREGGSIVVLGSAAASAPFTEDERAYSAAKAATVSYASQLAHAVAGDSIRVNAVLPGSIDFPGGFWERMRSDDPETYASAAETHALGRMAQATEVVEPIVFLASPAASFITGVALRVDGGLIKSVDL
jgi:3-oxoacyl-[acyl-carrier protein] reductase